MPQQKPSRPLIWGPNCSVRRPSPRQLGDAKTEEASKEHEHEAASWILHTKVRMVFFLVL